MKSFLYLMALGDSYGMKYEFVPHAQDKTAADLVHGPHPTYAEYQQGRYTDDTQMSLANLELLMASGKIPVPAQFIAAWLQAYKRDPREGYSKHMQKILSTAQDAAEFSAGLDPAKGVTSGAAMRAAPFGLLVCVEEVKELTLVQARLTHDTDAGRQSALAVALSVHFLHHGGDRKGLPAFLQQHLAGDLRSAACGHGEETNNGPKIVAAAIDAVLQAKTLSDVLLYAVNHAPVSDTDSICALAMAIASRARDIADDLPKALKDGLEDGPYGAAYLKKIDGRIQDIFPATEKYAAPKPKPAKRFGFF